MVTLDRYSTNNFCITIKGKSNYCHMTSVTLEAPPMVWDTVSKHKSRMTVMLEVILLVARIGKVRILFEECGKHTLGREGTAHGKCVSYHSELWLPPYCKHLADIVDEPSKVEPLLVRVNLPDPLCCLVTVEGVRIIRLQRARRGRRDRGGRGRMSHQGCRN